MDDVALSQQGSVGNLAHQRQGTGVGVVVAFRRPRLLTWLPADRSGYEYLAVAYRPQSRADHEQDRGTRAVGSGGNLGPFANAVAAFPRCMPAASALAELIWSPGLQPAEIWLFVRADADAIGEAAAAAGVECRRLLVVSYDMYTGSPVSVLRFRNVHGTAALLESGVLATVLQGTWLAFGGLPDAAFHECELCEGADYYLFSAFARESNLGIIMPGIPGMPKSWRFTAKHDAFRYDSGDPILCMRGGDDQRFLDAMMLQPFAANAQLHESEFSIQAFVGFAVDGRLAASG